LSSFDNNYQNDNDVGEELGMPEHELQPEDNRSDKDRKIQNTQVLKSKQDDIITSFKLDDNILA